LIAFLFVLFNNQISSTKFYIF